MEILFIQLSDGSEFKKITFTTGFVLQSHKSLKRYFKVFLIIRSVQYYERLQTLVKRSNVSF